jgi:hypothetical protein
MVMEMALWHHIMPLASKMALLKDIIPKIVRSDARQPKAEVGAA